MPLSGLHSDLTDCSTTYINFRLFVIGLFGWLVLSGMTQVVRPQGTVSQTPSIGGEEEPLIVEGQQLGDVFGLGRSVVVRGEVQKGVLALGGDVVVEGRVEGDVATIGGSVRQRDGSFIGGDVLVLGGVYHHSKTAPGRNPESSTIMIASYEDKLREVMLNPASILTPRWTAAAVGLRLISLVVWFGASLLLTLALPKAVSRSAARLHLTLPSVILIGLAASVLLFLSLQVVLKVFHPLIGLFCFGLVVTIVLGSYIFGRSVIQIVTGRLIQRRIWRGSHSETVALFIGAVTWSFLLSLPYVWIVALLLLVTTSLGLTFTIRWRESS